MVTKSGELENHFLTQSTVKYSVCFQIIEWWSQSKQVQLQPEPLGAEEDQVHVLSAKMNGLSEYAGLVAVGPLGEGWGLSKVRHFFEGFQVFDGVLQAQDEPLGMKFCNSIEILPLSDDCPPYYLYIPMPEAGRANMVQITLECQYLLVLLKCLLGRVWVFMLC